MKKLGLALGGGGLRGLAHIGVLQVLAQNHIKPQFISGTSSGSIIAALYACGMSSYEMEKMVLSLAPVDYIDYNLGGLIKLLLSIILPFYDYKLNGLLAGHKIEKLVYELTGGRRLTDVKVPVAIIACDINSGRKIIFSNQDIGPDGDDTLVIRDALFSEAVRSSISIPITFEPRQLMNMSMVDGGLKDIVPVLVNRSMGADYVVGVNLGQKIYDSPAQGLRQIISRTLSIMTYETSDTEEKIFADMLVFPGVPDTGLDDIKEAARIIRMGRRAMREKIPALKKDLQLVHL